MSNTEYSPVNCIPQVLSKDYLNQQDTFMRYMRENAPYMQHRRFLLCMDDESVIYMSNLGVRCAELDRSIPFEKDGEEVVRLMRSKASERAGRSSVIWCRQQDTLRISFRAASLRTGII